MPDAGSMVVVLYQSLYEQGPDPKEIFFSAKAHSKLAKICERTRDDAYIKRVFIGSGQR